MWKKAFWKAVAERSVKTFAQTLAVVLGAAKVGVIEADWIPTLSLAGMAALLSVLTSIGSNKIGDDGPSLTGEVLD